MTAANRGPLQPAVFLNRDGVINENCSDYVKSWEEFVFLPNVFGALRALLGTCSSTTAAMKASALCDPSNSGRSLALSSWNSTSAVARLEGLGVPARPEPRVANHIERAAFGERQHARQLRTTSDDLGRG